MKVALLCTVLLLAGAVSCSSVESNSITEWAAEAKLEIPSWIIDLISLLPESIQEIIDRLPEIIAQIPGILEQIPAIIAAIIDKIPEIIPIILDKLPEIIAQVPAILDQIKEIILQIIEKIPELIPIILEKIPEIIAAIPEICDKIREILEGLDLPDWLPTFPDLEKPEWWPDFPALPEINTAVPGTPTTVTEYPGIVQIEIGTGPIWVQGCAASVLTSIHLLSSASCFYGRHYDSRFRRVRAGSSTRFSGGSITQIQTATNHPSFVPGSSGFNGDIAVIRLTSNLVLSDTIQQTSIIADGFVLPTGSSVELAGWGSTAQGKLIADRQLYKIDLNIVDRGTCADRWIVVPQVTVTDNMICVARPETGGRNGDVRDIGAPVYFNKILMGVVSMSAPVGNQNVPVIVTSVASYTNWIVDNAV